MARLRKRGIDAEALPLIDIAPPRDTMPLVEAWRALARRQLLVFVSPNAVECFFALRPLGCEWPPTLVAAAPGPGTRAALRAHGVVAEAIVEPAADAPQFDSESLWQQLQRRAWRGASVLIVRGDGGRDWLAEQLRAAGAAVDFVSAYRRTAAVWSVGERQLLQGALEQPAACAWLFSSSEAIGHLLPLSHLAGDALRMRLRAATALATHPVIEARAREIGFARVEACRPTLDAVVACLQSVAAAASPAK